MQKDACFRLGFVANTHGIKGDLLCAIDADDPGRYDDLEHILVDLDGTLKSFAVQSFNLQGDRAYVHLEGIDSIEAAQPLRKRDLYLPLSMLPDPGKKKFYIHEAYGFTVTDKRRGVIGTFGGVVETPGHPVAQVRQGEKEILVPLVPAFIERIDRTGKTLYVDLPDGLLDLYL
jgi:16S rRNA processing protein RimM